MPIFKHTHTSDEIKKIDSLYNFLAVNDNRATGSRPTAIKNISMAYESINNSDQTESGWKVKIKPALDTISSELSTLQKQFGNASTQYYEAEKPNKGQFFALYDARENLIKGLKLAHCAYIKSEGILEGLNIRNRKRDHALDKLHNIENSIKQVLTSKDDPNKNYKQLYPAHNQKDHEREVRNRCREDIGELNDKINTCITKMEEHHKPLKNQVGSIKHSHDNKRPYISSHSSQHEQLRASHSLSSSKPKTNSQNKSTPSSKPKEPEHIIRRGFADVAAGFGRIIIDGLGNN
ncbi:hypothetical protein L3V83_04725 [Thiotrichales bacterium 19X7-9]|nr:hypothetical protein [Thiotrichales bacterium 19X7-9]